MAPRCPLVDPDRSSRLKVTKDDDYATELSFHGEKVEVPEHENEVTVILAASEEMPSESKG